MHYLDAEVHNVALLSGEAHLEGLLGAGQPGSTAAVYGPEDLRTPDLPEVLGVPHLVLHHRQGLRRTVMQSQVHKSMPVF